LGYVITKRRDTLIAKERKCVMVKGRERASIERIEHMHP
jgi:hypothetical protein